MSSCVSKSKEHRIIWTPKENKHTTPYWSPKIKLTDDKNNKSDDYSQGEQRHQRPFISRYHHSEENFIPLKSISISLIFTTWHFGLIAQDQLILSQVAVINTEVKVYDNNFKIVKDSIQDCKFLSTLEPCHVKIFSQSHFLLIIAPTLGLGLNTVKVRWRQQDLCLDRVRKWIFYFII